MSPFSSGVPQRSKNRIKSWYCPCMSPNTLTGASTLRTIGWLIKTFVASSANARICSRLKAKYVYPSTEADHSFGLSRWFKNSWCSDSTFLLFWSFRSGPLNVTTCGAYPFFYSISPFPILIFIFAFARLYIGGVAGLEIPGPKLVSGPPIAAWFFEGSPFIWLL